VLVSAPLEVGSVTDGSEQPHVLPTDDYKDYRRRVHYTAELLWLLGAGQQGLVALHAVLVEHNVDVKNATASPSERY
jgi:hypothetical protein